VRTGGDSHAYPGANSNAYQAASDANASASYADAYGGAGGYGDSDAYKGGGANRHTHGGARANGYTYSRCRNSPQGDCDGGGGWPGSGNAQRLPHRLPLVRVHSHDVGG
jgi:hypothetical protein